MAIGHFLDLFQWLLESITRALSIFVTAALLWLGLTIWLNGERQQPVAPLSAAGLLAAALFFLSHTMLLGRGLNETGFGMDFWRRLAVAGNIYMAFVAVVCVEPGGDCGGGLFALVLAVRHPRLAGEGKIGRQRIIPLQCYRDTHNMPPALF